MIGLTSVRVQQSIREADVKNVNLHELIIRILDNHFLPLSYQSALCFPPDGCLNGGECVRPSLCACQAYWAGRRCEDGMPLSLQDQAYMHACLLQLFAIQAASMVTAQAQETVFATQDGEDHAAMKVNFFQHLKHFLSNNYSPNSNLLSTKWMP